jgi:hypothetical protein
MANRNNFIPYTNQNPEGCVIPPSVPLVPLRCLLLARFRCRGLVWALPTLAKKLGDCLSRSFRYSKVTGWRGNTHEHVATSKPDTMRDWPTSQLHPQTPPPGTWEATPACTRTERTLQRRAERLAATQPAAASAAVANTASQRLLAARGPLDRYVGHFAAISGSAGRPAERPDGATGATRYEGTVLHQAMNGSATLW